MSQEIDRLRRQMVVRELLSARNALVYLLVERHDDLDADDDADLSDARDFIVRVLSRKLPDSERPE